LACGHVLCSKLASPVWYPVLSCCKLLDFINLKLSSTAFYSKKSRHGGTNLNLVL
jgi:hypothetical protein